MSGSIFLDSSQYSVNEASGTVTVIINRTGDTSLPVNLNYLTTGDPATPGSDFEAVSGSIVIEPGETSVAITIPIINDDLPEPTETFSFSIVSIDSGVLLAPRTTIIKIFDDEMPVEEVAVPPLVSNYVVSQEAVVENLNQPISFVFSPLDPDLMYVAEKGGVISVVDITTGAEVSTFIDISLETNSFGDRGLLDIVLDPNFPAEPYLYAFYTVDPAESAGLTGNAGLDGGGNRYGHVVRFEADPATDFTTVLPGSEPVILVGSAGQSITDISGDGEVDSTIDFSIPASDIDPETGEYIRDYIKVDSSTHMGGSLEFGPDGALYVSIGDGASFDQVDPRAIASLDLNSLTGKILRIDPDTGLGLPDNPFVDGQSLDENSARVYQLGLRNPYAMAISDDGRVFVSETGWFSWEEINSGPAGANFGWPYFEGGDNGVSLNTIGYQTLDSAQAYYALVDAGDIIVTPSIRAFSHIDSDPGFQIQGIVGSDTIYTGNVYPLGLQNAYFFTDVSEGEIFFVSIDDPSNTQFLYQTATGFGPVHFEQGPDGYMYYADLVTGQIGRFLIAPQPAVIETAGSASYDEETEVITLTADAQYNAGTATSTRRIDLGSNFVITFEALLGSNEDGGDGLAFFLHNAPQGTAAVGANGSGMGVEGIANLFGIEFDTYDSGTGDIAADHTNFFSGSPVSGALTPAVALGQLEDGAFHSVTVSWSAQEQTLTYIVDGVEVGSIVRDISTLDLDDSQFAYFGFGSGTGFSTNDHQVRIISAEVTYEAAGPGAEPPLQNQPLPQLAINGDAFETASNVFTLTPDTAFQSGSVMSQQRLDVSEDFVIAFRTNFGSKDADGADGLSFILHNDPLGSDAIGGAGGSLGADGIANGLAIAFSTFGGSEDSTYFLDTDGAFRSDSVSLGNVEDDTFHDVVVTWDTATQTLTYFVDGVQTGSLNTDIATEYLDGSTLAYFGFGAGTGSNSNLQQVELTVANGQFEAPEPGSLPTFVTNGTGSFDADRQVHVLTPNQQFARGNMMTVEQIDVNFNFVIEASVFLGANDGADGVAFILHNDPAGSAALGIEGGGYGVAGITNGIAIEFDTWFNAETELDIPNDHTSFFASALDNDFATTPFDLGEIEDGIWHDVTIQWDATTQELSYSFDGTLAGVLQSDLVTEFLDGSNLAYFGFGGGTGGTTNNHEVRVISFDGVIQGQQPTNAPTVAVPLADISGAIGDALDFAIPATTFDDPDVDDVLTLTATLADGTPLPAWLTFVDGTFTGTPGPDDASSYDITVTATDMQGNAVSDTFVLGIENPLSDPLPALLVNGSAAQSVSEGIITLTNPVQFQSGSAFADVELNLASDFRIAFDFYAGALDGGSDGLAFVLHNDPTGTSALGEGGSGLGYLGLVDGLAFEFDTFDSGPAVGDISDDHFALVDTDNGMAIAPAVALSNIEDDAWHRAVIDWDAGTQTLSFLIDGSVAGSVTGDIVTDYLGSDSLAFFGFSGGTGGTFNEQSVRITELDAVLGDGSMIDFVQLYSTGGGMAA